MLFQEARQNSYIILREIQWDYSLHVRNNPAPWSLTFLDSPRTQNIADYGENWRESKNSEAKV